MSLGDWLTSARQRLQDKEVDAPALVAQLAAAHVLGKDRSWVLAHPEAEVPPVELDAVLERLERNEPLAYITGHREFFGLTFEVSPAVLIPRQETEILVEAAIERAHLNARVLDIGTGSGCVAIALKNTRPDLTVVSVDISEDALTIARRNAEKVGCDIEFRLQDGIEAARESFDLIASNPPYIGESEATGPGVAEYEPHLALFAGPTGLEFYQRLAGEIRSPLLIEVGDSQADPVTVIFESAGHAVVHRYRDLLQITRVLFIEPRTS